MTRFFSGPDLVVATHNPGKIVEIRAVLSHRFPRLGLVSAADFGLAAPAETGATFAENALIKARCVAAATGRPALADDSGLCVDALDGAPGLYSADWAERPDGARDYVFAMEKVLRLLPPAAPRGASYCGVMALAWPDGHGETAEGRVRGVLADRPRGGQGHGYDPIFRPEGDARTYGEMRAEEKDANSHRTRALVALMDACFR